MLIYVFPLIPVLSNLLLSQHDFLSDFIKIMIHSSICEAFRSVNWHFPLESSKRTSLLFLLFMLVHKIMHCRVKSLYG